MNEDNDFQTLSKEIEDLRQRLDRLTTFVEMIVVFFLALIVLNFVFSSSGFIFIFFISILVLLSAVCCWNLENKGI